MIQYGCVDSEDGTLPTLDIQSDDDSFEQTLETLQSLETEAALKSRIKGNVLTTSFGRVPPQWDATILGLPDGRGGEIDDISEYAKTLSSRTGTVRAGPRTGQGEGTFWEYTGPGLRTHTAPNGLVYPQAYGYSNWADGVFFSSDLIGSTARAVVSYVFGVPSGTNPTPENSEAIAEWSGYVVGRDPREAGHLSGTVLMVYDFANQTLDVAFTNLRYYTFMRPKRIVDDMMWEDLPVANGMFGDCAVDADCIQGQFFDGSDGTSALSVGVVFQRGFFGGALGATRDAGAPVLDTTPDPVPPPQSPVPAPSSPVPAPSSPVPAPSNPPDRPPTSTCPSTDTDKLNIETDDSDSTVEQVVECINANASLKGKLEGHVLSSGSTETGARSIRTQLGLPTGEADFSDASGLAGKLSSISRFYNRRTTGRGKGGGWRCAGLLCYVDWVDGVFFTTTLKNTPSTSISPFVIGVPSGSAPTQANEEATAVWTGDVIGRDLEDIGHLSGDATLTYDFNSETLDVLFSNLLYYSGGSTPTYDVKDMEWEDLTVTDDGFFGDCSGSGDCIRGRFFNDSDGDSAQSVGMVFRNGTITGAAGAVRQ